MCNRVRFEYKTDLFCTRHFQAHTDSCIKIISHCVLGNYYLMYVFITAIVAYFLRFNSLEKNYYAMLF